MTDKKLKGRIALVTGASRGIGAAVAKRFGDEGAHVIITARTVSGLEEVDDYIKSVGAECSIVPLNLLEFDKIDQLGGIISQRFGKLDILVCNAGMLGQLSPIGHNAPDVWEKAFNLNVNANYRLIRSFDPLLRLSDAARVMFVTSAVAKKAVPYWGCYAATKSALEEIALTYAAEMKNTKTLVNLVDPGVVRTKMRAEAMPGEDAANLPEPEKITDIFVKLAEKSFNETGKIFKGMVQ